MLRSSLKNNFLGLCESPAPPAVSRAGYQMATVLQSDGSFLTQFECPQI